MATPDEPALEEIDALFRQCRLFPSAVEQTRIVAEVERRLGVMGELEQIVSAKVQRAIRLRQLILHDAFGTASSNTSSKNANNEGGPCGSYR